MKTRLLVLMFIMVLGGFSFVNKADALTSARCNLSRTLTIGSWGEDVRCLQSYLRNFGITSVSPDGNYGSLTYQAVARWQAANGLAPSGYFDAQSRARYHQIVGGGDTIIIDTGTLESQTLQRINEALVMIVNAEDAMDSRRNSGNARSLLSEAKADALNSVKAFFVGNFSKAMNLADEAYDNAQEAFERAGGSGSGGSRNRNDDIDDIEELIEEVDERIDDAQDEIDEAEDDGEDVDEAQDLLDEARDTLDDAEDEFDDGDYDDAEDSAEDADELVDDALDELDDNDNGNTNNDREDALNKIEDAEDEIDDAQDEIDEAEDDGFDVDDAEELLEDAEDLYDDAIIEFNRGNYDEAFDLADEAIETAEDAVDAIDD